MATARDIALTINLLGNYRAFCLEGFRKAAGSAQAKERQYGDNHYNYADDPEDVVHGGVLLCPGSTPNPVLCSRVSVCEHH